MCHLLLRLLLPWLLLLLPPPPPPLLRVDAAAPAPPSCPAGHFLLGPHWALGIQGDGHFEGRMRPVLIDHAASFRWGPQ